MSNQIVNLIISVAGLIIFYFVRKFLLYITRDHPESNFKLKKYLKQLTIIYVIAMSIQISIQIYKIIF